MSSSWHVAKLGDVCEFHNGLWKGEKGPFVNVGVIRNTNFTKEGTLDDCDIAYLDVEAKKFEKRKLQFGDIILEKSGGGPKQAVGRVVFFNKESGDFSFSNFTSAIRVRDQKVLAAEYLHRFLHWQYLSGVTESMQSHSTGIRNLNGDAYKAIEVRFPDVREQRRIVALLDEAFAGIATAKANAEKSLCNVRDVLAARVAFLLAGAGDDWVEKPLAEICVVDWGNTSLTKSSYVSDGRYLAVSAAGCDGRIAHREHAKHTPVLSAIGAQCGRMFFPDEDFTAIKNTITLTPREGICSGRFLFRLLTHVDLPKRGAAQPFMSKGDIQGFRVCVPSKPEAQEAVADQVDVLEAETKLLESLCTRKLAALDELKQSLLQRAFSGELT